MISHQRWWPDTCECGINQTHDPENSNYGVQFESFERKCPAHQSLSDSEAYNAIIENSSSEQKRKNGFYGYLLTISQLIQTDQNGVVVLKPGIDFHWRWSGTGADRVITIWLTGYALTAAQQQNAQQWCDSHFGAGAVVVNVNPPG